MASRSSPTSARRIAWRSCGDFEPGCLLSLRLQFPEAVSTRLSFGEMERTPDLEFRLLTREPMELFMSSDHRLAARKRIDPQEIAREKFLSISGKALGGAAGVPALRIAIDAYLKKCEIHIKPSYEVDNLAGAMSLITTTGSVALLPVYAKNLLSGLVTSRPLKGESPTIDLCLGYRRDNASPILKLLLSRLDELIARVSAKSR